MIIYVLIAIFVSYQPIHSQSWNTSYGIFPWESYIQSADIQRPLGLILDRSSLAHHHFAIGYFCLHSFMYDEAQDAFNMALNITPTFIEAHIGKMLTCKHPLSSFTDFQCGSETYDAAISMLNTSNTTLSPLQSGLLTTVYHWYADPSSVENGEQAFLSSIANLSVIYPNETDIRVLWGLSLLNVAFQGRYQGQMEPASMLLARDILKQALAGEPNHPGALHYLIHAYDVANYNISDQAISYVLTYQNLVTTLSYPQYIMSHIWIRTGALQTAKIFDDQSIRNSLTLCFIRITGRIVSISLTQLRSVLAQLETQNQIPPFLMCDYDNRATATELFSYTCMQTGDWLGAVSSINDLYIAYNQSLTTSVHHLTYAYRAFARVLMELFYWLPYDNKIQNKIDDLLKIAAVLPFVRLGDDQTDIDLAWSEAGYRFSDCLRLLSSNNSNTNQSLTNSIIDQHLARFDQLSNRTASLNQYISTSISIMIQQIQGIIFYKNNSFQDCLNALNAAAQREINLVIDNDSPILIYAHSMELLATHLLLIQRTYQRKSGPVITTSFLIDGVQVPLSVFPQRALDLYLMTNLSSPNRATNILGIARAYAQLRNNTQASMYYQILLNQINYTNNSDPIFLEEAINFLNQTHLIDSACCNHSWFLLILFVSSYSSLFSIN